MGVRFLLLLIKSQNVVRGAVSLHCLSVKHYETIGIIWVMNAMMFRLLIMVPLTATPRNYCTARKTIPHKESNKTFYNPLLFNK